MGVSCDTYGEDDKSIESFVENYEGKNQSGGQGIDGK
jgi:hypothetical protein